MPHVRMLTSMASKTFAFRRNQVVKASPEEARAWIDAGYAELVEPEKPETPEASKRRRSRRPQTRKIETR